jgi:hypothetical protein
MEVGTVPLDDTGGIRGLLVSDGFYRLVDTVGLVRDPAALLDAARKDRLGGLVAALRAREGSDPECVASAHQAQRRRHSAALRGRARGLTSTGFTHGQLCT